jgi:hypothetical protein
MQKLKTQEIEVWEIKFIKLKCIIRLELGFILCMHDSYKGKTYKGSFKLKITFLGCNNSFLSTNFLLEFQEEVCLCCSIDQLKYLCRLISYEVGFYVCGFKNVSDCFRMSGKSF